MSEDMSDMIQKVNDMIKNNEIPDDIKNMLNQFGACHDSSNDISSDKTTTDATSGFDSNSRDTSSIPNNDNKDANSIPNFDIGTMMKMKSIIDGMNKPQSDPRANLLRSLKPYLKSSRKDKVDQYIKIFSMGKVFEMMNPLEGRNEK